MCVLRKIGLKKITALFLLISLNACSSGVISPHQQTTQAAIASAHPLATQTGLIILKQGGNAFDAAVAMSATLAVVEPSSSGLGGGGFWLLHRASDGFETMLDGREKAPLAAHRDMYLNPQGDIIVGLSKNGALAAGIPGLPAALVHLSQQYGRLPLAQSLQPAIEYAQKGFVTDKKHQQLLQAKQSLLNKNPDATQIFLNNKTTPQQQPVLLQTDLANTLKQLAKFGKQGFYGGKVADLLIKGVQNAGGIWTHKDLDAYQVVERKPIKGMYKNIKITSASLPSSGGIVLLETLNILDGYRLDSMSEVQQKHIIIEAMRRAYRDRALYLGDSDFVHVPIHRLLNKDYAASLRDSIQMDKSTASATLSTDFEARSRGEDTTHFSIIDKWGNRVAATLSINFPFGSGFVPAGTGVLLNNEMDDFVSKVGAMNGYGLIGGKMNAITAGKRMLSSMTPTFLEDSERVAVLGTPGGSRIISMVLLAVLEFAKGNTPELWVKKPRFHHQYIPDFIQYEPQAMTKKDIAELTLLGHQLKPINRRYGNMQAVLFNKKSKTFIAASDPRGEGVARIQ